jgi:hypothetical protein
MIVKTEPHEECPDQTWCVYFENGGASANIAILQDVPELAYLYNVFSTNRRSGEASELIREIDEYCIKNKLSLIVEAVVFDEGRSDGIPDNEKLKSWYEKNGAQFIEYNDEGHPMLLLGDPEGPA